MLEKLGKKARCLGQFNFNSQAIKFNSKSRNFRFLTISSEAKKKHRRILILVAKTSEKLPERREKKIEVIDTRINSRQHFL
jgi:hypothetical protein